jgi:hypothetical protein
MKAVVIGKVVEVDPEPTDVAVPGPVKGQKNAWKVATIQVNERIFGAAGITRVRVGFLANAPALEPLLEDLSPPPPPSRRLPGQMPALAVGIEGCFILSRGAAADFYTLRADPIRPKDPKFASEVAQLRTIATVLDEPVAALKAKELNRRFEAAQIILQRYLMPQGSNQREPIPEAENKLILALLAELPWLPADGKRVGPDGKVIPQRSAIWYSINSNEVGFKAPPRPKQQPGDPPADYDKLMDKATSEFLKKNAEKIRIKRFVEK